MSTTLTLMMTTTTTMTMMMREEPHFARCTAAPVPLPCPRLASPHTQHLSGCHSLTLTATCSVCSYVVSCFTVVLTHTQQLFAPPSSLPTLPCTPFPRPATTLQ